MRNPENITVYSITWTWGFHATVISISPFVLQLRQRRRQQYHAARKIRRKPTTKRRTRQYKTKDRGLFPVQLKPPRRVVAIEKKLLVLDRYEELLAARKKAEEAAQEPRPLGRTRAEVKEWAQKRKQARRDMRKGILKTLREEFTDIVKGAQPRKWLKTAQQEQWRNLPETTRARCSATSNEWRSKLKLPKKGRSYGGSMPMELQKELDILMMEHSSGLSDVSERKELVTVEHVATWIWRFGDWGPVQVSGKQFSMLEIRCSNPHSTFYCTVLYTQHIPDPQQHTPQMHPTVCSTVGACLC